MSAPCVLVILTCLCAQLRALMYVATLTSEIMDSMVAVENAAEGALERQTTIRASLHWRKKTAAYKRCAVSKPSVNLVPFRPGDNPWWKCLTRHPARSKPTHQSICASCPCSRTANRARAGCPGTFALDMLCT